MSNESTKYNGWTNYETWAVNLWLTNDEGSDTYYRDMAEQAFNDAEADRNFTRKESAASDLAEVIKREITDSDLMPKVEGLYADLLNASLSEVNWYEIAMAFLEDFEDEEHTVSDEERSNGPHQPRKE